MNQIASDQIREKNISLQTFMEQNPFFGEQGSLIKGTVVQGGKDPIVDFGGTAIHVKSELLSDATEGDELNLKVQKEDSNSVVLQLVDEYLSQQGEVTGLKASQTQIAKNTEQFVTMLEEYDPNVAIVNGNISTAKNLGISMSSQDIEQLRQMGIDVSNGNIGHLISLIQDIHQKTQEERVYPESQQEEMDQMKENAKEIGKVTKGELSYILQNQGDLSYSCIYEARYSGMSEESGNSLDETVWDELLPQIQDLLQQEGIELNDDTLDAAKWMMQQDLEISKDTIQFYMDTMEYNETGLNETEYEGHLKEAENLGESLASVPLYGMSLSEKAKSLMDQVSRINEEDIEAVVSYGRPNILQSYFTINLSNQEGEENRGNGENGKEEKELSQEDSEKVTSAKLLIARIQLQMTESASRSLLAQKLPVETMELRELVSRLEQENDQPYQKMLEAHQMEASADNINQFKNVVTVVNEIPKLPIACMASLAVEQEALEQDNQGVSLLRVYESGMELSARYQQAGEAYETMSTEVRSDLGDSITKAFQNVSDLLTENHIPVTSENEKAARILGYNQMDITQDNIQKVATLDRSLMSIVDGLKPEMVLDFIREGDNPITMTLSELQQKITGKQEQISVGEEKYSEFLHNLDKQGNITEEERSSFIGVYRLLHTVTRHSDRELGAVVKNEQELTLGNLLAAYRSRNAQGMNIEVTDEFGMVDSISFQKQRIDEQINIGFSSEEKGKMEYSKSLCESLYQNVSVEGIKEAEQVGDIKVMSMEELEDFFMANQTPVAEDEMESQCEQIYQDSKKLEDIKESTVKLMNEYEIPMTLANVETVSSMLEPAGNAFSYLKKQLEKAGISKEDSENIINDYKENILDEDDTSVEAAHAFKEEIDVQVHQDDEVHVITREQMAAMRQIHTATAVMCNMERQDTYLVPVTVKGTIVAMKVSLRNGMEEKARVDLSIPYGEQEIQANIQIQNGELDGNVQVNQGEIPSWAVDSIKKLKEEMPKVNSNNKRELMQIAKAFLELMEE